MGTAFDFGSVALDSNAISAPFRLNRRPLLNTLVFAGPFCVRVTWRILLTAPPPKLATKISALPSALLVARFALDIKATTVPSEDREGLD